MNTLEQSSLDHDREQAEQEITQQLHPEAHNAVGTASSYSTETHNDDHTATLGSEPIAKPKISGFDGGNRHVLKEPSLYLSVAIIAVATLACLNRTPMAAGISFAVLSLIAVVFHILAERRLFRAKKEFDVFAAPFEGVFVVTFGAILPGLGLLAYGINSLFSASPTNIPQEIGKLALLVIVPLFNFGVWSALRRGYLVRPRLAGVMNGFALGLSACWTAIWMKTAFMPTAGVSCKLGWMLLLCTSPFLLFAAACLAMDLWHKTEANIKRITTTFSAMGIALSVFFVFTPMARGMFIQQQLDSARHGTGEKKAEAIVTLRSAATEEDLRPWKFPVGGFALGELLIPNRGLSASEYNDRDLYFKLTGKSFFDSEKKNSTTSNADMQMQNPAVGGVIPGLSLTKSQIAGSINADTLSSSIDWTLTFHNSTSQAQESRCEIALPKDAVVSRATLWIDGEPKEGAFDSSMKVRAAYENVVGQRRDPLLVTMSAPDHVLIQSFPVPVAGDQKIRIGFKVPLETKDGKTCTMELPKILNSNFGQPKRHRVTLHSQSKPINNLAGVVATKSDNGFDLNGIIKTNDKSKSIGSIIVQRNSSLKEFATPDWFAKDARFIIAKLQKVTTPAIKKVYVVVDGSALLKDQIDNIKDAISSIPTRFKPAVFIASETNSSLTEDNESEQGVIESDAQTEDKPVKEDRPVAMSAEDALVKLTSDTFVGGQDNYPTLREALETAAEEPNCAVLWVHGPQPLTAPQTDSKVLDLVNRVSLHDLQIVPGLNTAMQKVKQEDVSNYVAYETIELPQANAEKAKDAKEPITFVDKVKALVSTWARGTQRLALVKSYSWVKPNTAIITDKTISAQVTCLWARDEVARLLSASEGHQAKLIGAKYRIVTPITGVVILQSFEEYKSAGLDPVQYKDGLGTISPALVNTGGSGLVGAPVDPRYGQSNEVGQLADFGYDTARDIVRWLTAFSLLISLFVAFNYLRMQKSISGMVIAKSAAMLFVVPVSLHFIGVFFINNFGGLGGGL